MPKRTGQRPDAVSLNADRENRGAKPTQRSPTTKLPRERPSYFIPPDPASSRQIKTLANSNSDTQPRIKTVPVRGPAVSHHALRNLAALDVAKSDRLMKRIAERAGESVTDLCERLSKLSGDRVGVVDLVLWYAASVGIIEGISHSRRLVRCAPGKP